MRFYTYTKQFGDNILVRGWDDEKGGHFKEKVPFSPTLFLPTTKPTKYKTLDGTTVAPVQPGSIKECKEFVRNYVKLRLPRGFDKRIQTITYTEMLTPDERVIYTGWGADKGDITQQGTVTVKFDEMYVQEVRPLRDYLDEEFY